MVYLTSRKMMNRRSQVASVLLVTMLSVAGCSNRPAGYSRAYGKLLYKGEAAAGAFLMFHLDPKPQSGDVVASSTTVEEDGSFEVVSPTGNGASPGKYKVLVAWRADEPIDEAATGTEGKSKIKKGGSVRRKNKVDAMAKDRFKGRCANDDRPLTTVEVKAQTTDLSSLEIED
jgi:hypothetical protein